MRRDCAALCARRRKVHSAPVPPDGETSVRSLASPLPTQTALLGLRGGPWFYLPQADKFHTCRVRSVFVYVHAAAKNGFYPFRRLRAANSARLFGDAEETPPGRLFCVFLFCVFLWLFCRAPAQSFISSYITALMVCIRFSASSKTRDAGDSKTWSVTSMASRPNRSPISRPTWVLWSW